ncbi:hypothetical protein KAR91_71955, partial [Candidatus Pacearchaeota archaeon]|nr:hypothetical protein [Candidatus Pacearchaeota archaeon]
LSVVFLSGLIYTDVFGAVVKSNKSVYKTSQKIKAKCSGLNSKKTYSVGIYKSGNLVGQIREISGKVKKTARFNNPGVGSYSLLLKLKKNGKVKASAKFTVGGSGPEDPPVDPPVNPPSNGNKNFTASSGTTDLTYTDTTTFISGYKSAGYSFKNYTKKVKASQLKSYLQSSNNMHFHSGHGYAGGMACVDKDLNAKELKVQVMYSIFATCTSLKSSAWYNAFGSNAKMVMGFTDNTTDSSCLSMAKSFPSKIKSGQSYLKAWYLVNSAIKQHQDRWATYIKEGSKIVFYSAKGKHPYIAYSGRKRTLSDGVKTYAMAYKSWERSYFGRGTGTATLVKSKQYIKFKEFPKYPRSTGGSVAISEAYDSLGSTLPDNADVDEIIPIERCVSANVCSVVAYNVYFVQKYNGFPIRSNSKTDRISILVGEYGVVATDVSWSKISPINYMFSAQIPLSVSEALKTAADDISNTTKQAVLIVGYERVYGAVTNDYENGIIVPAYEFIGSKGERFVVSAFTGKLI